MDSDDCRGRNPGLKSDPGHPLNSGALAGEALSREDAAACGKESLDKAVMQRLVQVSAAVADDGNAVVGIYGLVERGEHDTTGRYAEKYQRIDVVGAKNHAEIRTGEST